MLDREGVHRIDREGVHRILAAVNLPLVPNSEPDPWGDPLPSPEDRLLADLEGWQSIHRTGEVQRRRPADREELARGIIVPVSASMRESISTSGDTARDTFCATALELTRRR
jgi:hypothetical protein